MTPTIRDGGPGDASAIVRIMRILFPAVDDTDAVRRRVAAFMRRGTVLVADAGDEIVGLCAYIIERFGPTDDGPTLWVDALAVEEHARRQGVARLLMDEAQLRAYEARCTMLMLHTHAEMTEALALYDTTGFERHGLLMLKDI